MKNEEEYNARKAVMYGPRNLDEEAALMILFFAERYGWSPKDVLDLDWKILLMLKVMVEEIDEMKKTEVERYAHFR